LSAQSSTETGDQVAAAALQVMGRQKKARIALQTFKEYQTRLLAHGKVPGRAVWLAALAVYAAAGSPRFTKAAQQLVRAMRECGIALGGDVYAPLIAAAGNSSGRGRQPVAFRCDAAQAVFDTMLRDGVTADGACYEALIRVFVDAAQPDKIEAAISSATASQTPLTRNAYIAALRGFARAGRLQRTLETLLAWRSAATDATNNMTAPDGAAYAAVIAACASAPAPRAAQRRRQLDLAWGVIADMRSAEVPPSRESWHALMDVALAAGDAASVFDARAEMATAGFALTGSSWNRLVAAGARRSAAEAIGLIEEMQRGGMSPSSSAIAAALTACAREGDVKHGNQLVSTAIQAGMLFTGQLAAARLRCAACASPQNVVLEYRKMAILGTPLAKDRRFLSLALEACFGVGGLASFLGVTFNSEDGSSEDGMGTYDAATGASIHVSIAQECDDPQAACELAIETAEENPQASPQASSALWSDQCTSACILLEDAITRGVVPKWEVEHWKSEGETRAEWYFDEDGEMTAVVTSLTRAEAAVATMECLQQATIVRPRGGIVLRATKPRAVVAPGDELSERERMVVAVLQREGLPFTRLQDGALRITYEAIQAWPQAKDKGI